MTNCNCVPFETSKGQIAHSTECIYFSSKKPKIISDKEILEKAIDKAGKNGYENSLFGEFCNCYCGGDECFSESACIYTTIFNHDFAKAFWSDGRTILAGHITIAYPPEEVWKGNLEAMILEEEPLQYLAKFLSDNEEKTS